MDSATTFKFGRRSRLSRPRAWLLALLAAGLALTRTAALPTLAVLALWLAASPAPDWRARLRRAAPALAALAAYGLWVLLRPAHTGEDYGQILAVKGAQFLGGPGGLLGSIAGSVARQANAILEGWAGSLMVYWIEGRPARFALASLAGALALAGLALRLRRGRADAWMSAAYLATLLAWPFHEQMERFLFPLVPVLVLYAFQAAGEGMVALQRPDVSTENVTLRQQNEKSNNESNNWRTDHPVIGAKCGDDPTA